MNIFNIFAGGFMLILIIRLVVILLNFSNSNGADKITRLVGAFISILLVSITWGIIYAFFGYETTPAIKNEKPKSSIIKFNDNKNGK